nr:transposase [Saccharothrix sp. 6-C]
MSARPGQSGYNRRLHAALPLVKQVMRWLAADTDLWTDTTWIVDSTPVECGRSLPTVKRSELAGWAKYGFCRSHSRWFRGLRLHLVCTPAGLPITWASADPNIDEPQVLMAICDHEPHLLDDRPRLLIIADKGYVSAEPDRFPAERGVRLIRPSYRNRTPHPGEPLLKSVRHLIESVNNTVKGQLNLEQHGGRTIEGVGVRIAQRQLARTAAIRHNRATGQPITRSLTTYDH